MDSTSFFEFKLPEKTDRVDIKDINDNMEKIDHALLSGICKISQTGNSIGDGTQAGSPKGWAPYFEIKNPNDTEVVVTDRNYGGMDVTYTIAAGKTFRKYFGEMYTMNFIAADSKEVEFSWFVSTQEYIDGLEVFTSLYRKELLTNNMGSSTPGGRQDAEGPYFEIINNNNFDVTVTDRNYESGTPGSTIEIAAGKTYRKYINEPYFMNFYVQDLHDVTFRWYVNTQEVIDALTQRVAALEAAAE